MRTLLTAISTLVAILVCACAAPAPVAETCWEHHIEIANTDGNLLTLCVAGNNATGTIRFANLGGVSALCRQQGLATTLAGGAFSLAFDTGSCQSGRKFEAATFECTAVDEASMRCVNRTVKTPLLFKRRP